jgi:hypothetical protein
MSAETITKPLIETEGLVSTIYFYSDKLIEDTQIGRATAREEGVERIPSALTALLVESGRDIDSLNLSEQSNLQLIEQTLCQLDDDKKQYKFGVFTGFGKNVKIRGGMVLGIATESQKIGLSIEAYQEIKNRISRLNQLSQEGYFFENLNLSGKTSYQRKLMATIERHIGKILGLSVDIDVRTTEALPQDKDITSRGIHRRETSIGPRIVYIVPNRRPKEDTYVVSPLEHIELLSEKDDLVRWRSDLEESSLQCTKEGLISIERLPQRKNGRYQMSFNESSEEFYKDKSLAGEILRLRFRSKSLSYGVINYAEISGDVNKCAPIKETISTMLIEDDKTTAPLMNKILIELFKSYHISPDHFLELGRSLGILDETSKIDPTQNFAQFLQSELGEETFFDLTMHTFINDPSIFGMYLIDMTDQRAKAEEYISKIFPDY